MRRVLDASQSLDSRIAEIDDSRTQVEQQLAISSELSDQVRGVLDTTLVAAGELEPA